MNFFERKTMPNKQQYNKFDGQSQNDVVAMVYILKH